MNNSPFKVSIDNIVQLIDINAVRIFKALLHAEAYKHKLPLDKIQISENIKEPDG